MNNEDEPHYNRCIYTLYLAKALGQNSLSSSTQIHSTTISFTQDSVVLLNPLVSQSSKTSEIHSISTNFTRDPVILLNLLVIQSSLELNHNKKLARFILTRTRSNSLEFKKIHSISVKFTPMYPNSPTDVLFTMSAELTRIPSNLP